MDTEFSKWFYTHVIFFVTPFLMIPNSLIKLTVHDYVHIYVLICFTLLIYKAFNYTLIFCLLVNAFYVQMN